MKQKPAILIVGCSLFSHAIEATLAALPGVQVCRYDPEQDMDAELIAAAALIIVEASNRLIDRLTLMPRFDIPILIVNAEDEQITVIQRQFHEFHQMSDLENLIITSLRLGHDNPMLSCEPAPDKHNPQEVLFHDSPKHP